METPKRLFSSELVEITIQTGTAATVVGTGVLDEQVTRGTGTGGRRVYYDHEPDLGNEGRAHGTEAGAFAKSIATAPLLEDEVRGHHSGLIGNPVLSRLRRAACRRPMNVT